MSADIVAAAERWLGTPYRHQAAARGAGCDCLGLLRGVYAELVGPLDIAAPAYMPDWAEEGRREALIDGLARHLTQISPDDWRAGDVLVFRWRAHVPAKHAGIASAHNRLIHVHEGAGCCEVALVPHWRRRIAAAFSFPKVEG